MLGGKQAVLDGRLADPGASNMLPSAICEDAKGRKFQWARRVSNLRPLACEAGRDAFKKAQETALASQTDTSARRRATGGVCGVIGGFGPPNARSGQKSRVA